MSLASPAAENREAAAVAPTFVICRSAERRTRIEQTVPGVRAFTSALEGVLAVAREQPEAVVVNLDDVEGREADLVRALGRARPGLRIYLVVAAHSEPLARQLVKSGATGYLVATSGLQRLPQMLSRTPPPDAGGAGEPGPAAARWESLFEASCALAGLASCQSETILREGLYILARATGARHASIFTRATGAQGLELRAAMTVPGESSGRLSDFERSCAARGAEAPKPLFFTMEAADAAPAGEAGAEAPMILAALPLREEGAPHGALCLQCDSQACPAPEAWQPVARLVASLARLYGAALRREAHP